MEEEKKDTKNDEGGCRCDGACAEGGCDGKEQHCEQCREYKAGWQRALADYDNLKKDVERMREEMAKYAAAGMVEKLLPVMDSFATAGAQAPETADEKVLQWCKGILHVQTQFEGALAAAGLQIIDEVGVPFDPEIHEAMLREKAEGRDADTVIEVLQPGYRLHDRVIRAAKVKVAE